MKSMMTQGDWQVATNANPDFIGIANHTGKWCLATMSWPAGIERVEVEANAKAVAALPALISALQIALKNYGNLHDALSDCIEGGRLRESDIPDDYRALVHHLSNAVTADFVMKEALKKAGVLA